MYGTWAYELVLLHSATDIIVGLKTQKKLCFNLHEAAKYSASEWEEDNTSILLLFYYL